MKLIEQTIIPRLKRMPFNELPNGAFFTTQSEATDVIYRVFNDVRKTGFSNGNIIFAERIAFRITENASYVEAGWKFSPKTVCYLIEIESISFRKVLE